MNTGIYFWSTASFSFCTYSAPPWQERWWNVSAVNFALTECHSCATPQTEAGQQFGQVFLHWHQSFLWLVRFFVPFQCTGVLFVFSEKNSTFLKVKEEENHVAMQLRKVSAISGILISIWCLFSTINRLIVCVWLRKCYESPCGKRNETKFTSLRMCSNCHWEQLNRNNVTTEWSNSSTMSSDFEWLPCCGAEWLMQAEGLQVCGLPTEGET